MITTLDKVVRKRGEYVWEIGVTIGGLYQPTRSKVHGQGLNRVINPNRCWSTYQLCEDECNQLNNLKTAVK